MLLLFAPFAFVDTFVLLVGKVKLFKQLFNTVAGVGERAQSNAKSLLQ